MSNTPADLLAAIGVAPSFPGAKCRGRHHLFDEAAKDEPPEIVAQRHTQALRLCRQCTALAGCQRWFDGLPLRDQPRGVIAAQIHPARGKRGTPDTPAHTTSNTPRTPARQPEMTGNTTPGNTPPPYSPPHAQTYTPPHPPTRQARTDAHAMPGRYRHTRHTPARHTRTQRGQTHTEYTLARTPWPTAARPGHTNSRIHVPAGAYRHTNDSPHPTPTRSRHGKRTPNRHSRPTPATAFFGPPT